MRIADPATLNLQTPFETVITAAMPKGAVEGLSNALRPVDQWNAPGPATMAALELDSGDTLLVVHHEARDILEILAPHGDRVEDALAEVLPVLGIAETAIEWHRGDVSLSRIFDRHVREVFVLESSPLAQDLLRDALSARGYRVHLIESWTALTDKFSAITPDLVLVDVDAHAVDKFGGFERLSQQAQDVPVLMLNLEPGSLAAPPRYAHFASPTTKEELLEIVESLAV